MGALGKSFSRILFEIKMETKVIYPEDRGEELADEVRYFYPCPISGINLVYDIRLMDVPDELLLALYSQGDEPLYISDSLQKQYSEYEYFTNLNDNEVLGIQEFIEQIYSESAKLIKYRVIYPDGENEWTDYFYQM